jgi:hypothetical protein
MYAVDTIKVGTKRGTVFSKATQSCAVHFLFRFFHLRCFLVGALNVAYFSGHGKWW